MSDLSTLNRLLTPEQAAELLQVSKRTIYEWLRNNEIPHERIGDRLIRIRESDILSPDARAFFEQGCKLAQFPDKIEQAAQSFNKAIELSPRYMLAYFELGRMYYVWSDFWKAVEPLKKAVEFNPSFPAYFYLGLNYKLLGRHNEAAQAFTEANRLMPDHLETRFELGFAKFMVSLISSNPIEAKEAIIQFRKILDLKPDHEMAAYYLGHALVLRLHEFDAALAFAKEIEENIPSIAENIRLIVHLNRRN